MIYELKDTEKVLNLINGWLKNLDMNLIMNTLHMKCPGKKGHTKVVIETKN